MIALEQETIEQTEIDIIPEVFGCVDDATRAYEQGARPDGGNNFDNYLFGCACWNSLFNRLSLKLDKHPFFITKIYKKVLEITCCNGGKPLTFYVCRVDETERIPCAGRSIKLQLQKQAFLSDEVQSLIARSKSSAFMIGYDADPVTGLGKITFDMLTSTGKGHFQSDTLYVFKGMERKTLAKHAPQENIKHPAVTREDLASHQKKATK